MPHARTIAVDFDGVIHAYSKGWHDGTIYDGPVEGARAAIRRLMNKGYRVVIFTARDHSKEQHRAMVDWLAHYGFPPGLEITAVKPPAIAYIDDRAIRFTNWTDAGNYF